MKATKNEKPQISIWSLAANRTCNDAAVSPYKYSYASFLFYNSHLIHCLPKVGLHALYIIISVILQTFIAPRERGSKKNHWMKNKI